MKNEIMERPIEYVTDTGTEVKLTVGMVRHFLVSGKSELATDQEIIYFMKLCQARKLNPFLKECYLIKYDQSPAAIITARSTFQNNARMSDDCQGWKFGVIVQDEKGLIKRTAGLVLENQKIVGGWFSAKPKGWDEPFELEVNLSHYIKTTRDGRPTQFWTPEKQAGMIAKVAEVQGLRTLWGKNTSGMYEADEIAENAHPLPLKGFNPEAVNDPAPEISAGFTPEDFDNEFQEEIQEDEWPDFWKKAVDFHAEQGIDEDKLKVDIVSGDVVDFRVAFQKFATAKTMVKKAKQDVADIVEQKEPAEKPEKKKTTPKKPAPKKTPSKTAKATKKKQSDLKAQAEMIESEAWAGCQAYKEHYPDIWADETGGAEPQTVAECTDLLDRMQAVRDARESSQDAGDDIPY
jgi:phage recombination protein Bet